MRSTWSCLSAVGLVERIDAGVVLMSDGEDVTEIRDGIRELMKGRRSFAENAFDHREAHLWEAQNATLATLLDVD